MAGWRDAPVVSSSKGKWQDAPVVEQPDSVPVTSAPIQAAPQQESSGMVGLHGLPIDRNPFVDFVNELNRAGGVTPEQEAAGEARRGTLAPVMVKDGQMHLAWPQAALEIAKAVQLPGQVLSGEAPFDPRVSYRDQDPATLDSATVLAGGVGAELPLAARGMVRGTARNLVDTQGRPMPKLVADELERVNVSPARLQSELDALGPASIIGDLSPRLQARVGAVATTPSPGQDMIVQALMARQRGANARIQGSIDETLGPAPIPSRVAAGIREGQQALSPEYQRVLANATSGDISAVAASVENGIMQEKGPARAALQKVRAFLDFTPPAADGLPPMAPMLDNNPTGWLKARQAIDGLLDGETDRNVIRVLTGARRQIDERLTEHVPGIKQVDAQFEQLARQQEGFELGQRAIRPGDAPLHPADFADQFAVGSAPEGVLIGPSGVPIRIRQGLLADIERIVGTKANDRVALKEILKGEGSWNREKLVTAFGEDRTQRLIDLLDAEATMAQTENLAFGNSKTEVIRSAKEGIEPSRSDGGFVRSAANLKFGDAAVSLADKFLGGAIKTAQQTRNSKIANALLSRTGWTPSAGRSATSTGLVPASNVAIIEALIDRYREAHGGR